MGRGYGQHKETYHIEPNYEEDRLFRRLKQLGDEELARLARRPNYFERGQCVHDTELRLGPAGVAAKILSLRRSSRYDLNRVIAMASRNLG